jgi:hypothetical protein
MSTVGIKSGNDHGAPHLIDASDTLVLVLGAKAIDLLVSHSRLDQNR